MMRGKCVVLHNHKAIDHKQFVKDTIALVPDGGNWKDLPAGVGESRKFHMAWTRYRSDAPSRTIDTGHLSPMILYFLALKVSKTNKSGMLYLVLWQKL